MSKRGNALLSGFLAPGSNPMLVMALANPSTDLKKNWLSDLGVFSCSWSRIRHGLLENLLFSSMFFP